MIIAELARESDFIIAFRFPPGFVEKSPGSRANACAGPGLIDVFRSVFSDLPVEVRARLAATLLRDSVQDTEPDPIPPVADWFTTKPSGA